MATEPEYSLFGGKMLSQSIFDEMMAKEGEQMKLEEAQRIMPRMGPQDLPYVPSPPLQPTPPPQPLPTPPPRGPFPPLPKGPAPKGGSPFRLEASNTPGEFWNPADAVPRGDIPERMQDDIVLDRNMRYHEGYPATPAQQELFNRARSLHKQEDNREFPPAIDYGVPAQENDAALPKFTRRRKA